MPFVDGFLVLPDLSQFWISSAKTAVPPLRFHLQRIEVTAVALLRIPKRAAAAYILTPLAV